MSDTAIRADSGARETRRRPARGGRRPVGLLLLASAIAAVFAIPVVFVIVETATLRANVADTFTDVTAPLWRTIQLAVLVSATAAVIGTTLAWLTVRTDLPFRRTWRVALMLPLVLPSFVGAGAFIAGIAQGGIIHDALDVVGITPPRRFRGLGASWLVLSAFTYPYVLLPVSARLQSLRSSQEESARMLGMSSRGAFVRVTLPAIRSSVVAGALLVFLYSLSEFGAVQLLGYDTLTRVIFATRSADARDTSFAAATILLVLAVAAVAAERRFRGRSVPDSRSGTITQRPTSLGAWRVPATLLCTSVVAIGLVVPVTSLVTWAWRGLTNGTVDLGELVEPTISTATISIAAAVITVAVVMPIAIENTRRPGVVSAVASSAVLGGFAVPGLVIALALVVLALNVDGLGWLYQSFGLLLLGYVIHFGSQALASAEQAVRAVPDRVREQARLLEPNARRRLVEVELPLMRPGLVAGGGLVLLATAKELPATLLLAPLGFSTLATDIWSGFGEGFYAETGVASLTLIAVSALLTWLLVLRPMSRG